MSDLRVKEYDLKAGDVRQIKILDIEKPIRFEVVSGTFTFDHYLADVAITTGNAVSSGVVVAPGGAWGSEIRINCTAAGKLVVTYMG